MGLGLGYVVVVIVVVVYLGKIKVPGNVWLDHRYNPDRARFTTPGRNARQQQLASQRKARDTRPRETVFLENYEGEGDGIVKDKGEFEGEEGGFIEHPELTRQVRDDRALRVAAAEARMKKDKANAELARRRIAERKAAKGRSALEQASAENVGWRNIDEVREMRSYN